ncbi:hypothetical protein BJ912DRAFT_372019 [Pholiota molesta]|nr:hypothetical protein BJ912DRAFT_372019 [Pholiota molesta]
MRIDERALYSAFARTPYADNPCPSLNEARAAQAGCGDLSDSTSLVYIVTQVQRAEVYILCPPSHVKVSFEMAEYLSSAPCIYSMRLAPARSRSASSSTRGSTSELYAKVVETSRSKTIQTPFYRARRACTRSATRTGLSSTTARRTLCLRATASCSTTIARGGAGRSRRAG